MSIQPLTFTGVSSLSDSLQQVLSRAVSIASIPLKQLQSADANALQKKSLMTGVASAAEALGSAVARLGTVAGRHALGASSSNPAKVTVTNTGSTNAVAYTITDITSLAAAASASTRVFANSNSERVSNTGKLELVVDGKTSAFTLANNTLAGLRDAINGLDAGVTATILTASPTENYLSISSNSTGELKSLRLTDLPSQTPVQLFGTKTLGSAGTAATATMTAVADPEARISANGQMRLVIGSTVHNLLLAPDQNSLTGLQQAIDALEGVSATIGGGNQLTIARDSAGAVSAFTLVDDPDGLNGTPTPMLATTSLGDNPSKASGTTASFPDTTMSRVSMTGVVRLVIGSGDPVELTLADNSLAGLKAAVNALPPEVGVTASIDETTRTLSITSTAAGAVSDFQLIDNPGGAAYELLAGEKTNLGADAVFKLNGIPMTHGSNTVTGVVAGMAFTILDKTAENESIRLNLASDRNQLSTAIAGFVSSYNDMQEVVGQQVGANAGLLTGEMIVRDVQTNLRALASYGADGAIKSLSEMGVTFDTNGKVSFDETAFGSLADSEFRSAISFFGSSTTGFGALAKKFTELTDPVNGAIKVAQDDYDRTDRTLQQQIATAEERISALQIATAQRLQAADALLARLESQQNIINASIQGANVVLYGKNDK